jgi:hypothetical protein
VVSKYNTVVVRIKEDNIYNPWFFCFSQYKNSVNDSYLRDVSQSKEPSYSLPGPGER